MEVEPNNDFIETGVNTQTTNGIPNFELAGYEYAFGKWLSEAKHFRQFITRITEELARIGFSDWTYTRLDCPPALGIEDLIGTTTKRQIEYFSNVDFRGEDLTNQHISKNTTPILRSKVNEFVANSPVEVEAITGHRKIVELCDKFHFYDLLALPLFGKKEKSHARFTVTNKGEKPKYFTQKAIDKYAKVKIIASLTEEIGIDKYPAVFLDRTVKFEKIINSRGLLVLETMFKKDLNIPDVAAELGMSNTAADKQLGKIREKLHATTNHGAIMKAIEAGLIKPK